MAYNAAHVRAYQARNRDRIRVWHRAWMVKNRDHVNAWQLKRGRLSAAYMDSLKAEGCVDCDNKNLIVLELDHVRGTKLHAVSGMRGFSFAKIDAEVAKCEVRCANCHRIATARRRAVA